MRGRRHRSSAWTWFAILAVAASCGCAAPKRSGDVLAAKLSDLMPHGDRDHFVYLSERTAADASVETSMMVEHITTLPAPGEFQVSESTNGVPSGDSHWIADDRGIFLLSEEVEGLGVRLSYDPPLLLFPEPLLVGEHRASATGAATRLDDGQSVGVFQASVLVKSSATRASHPLAKGPAVAFEVTRSIKGPNGALVIHIDSINAEGVGELESIAALDGTPLVVHRALLCGFIQGRPIGHCDELK